MKMIEQISWGKHLTELEVSGNSDVSLKTSDDFIPLTLPVLASIPLVYNDKGLVSTSQTIQKLKNTGTITTPNSLMSGANALDLLRFITTVPRSKLQKSAFNKLPTYGTFTPLFLYAHKLYNNVPYNKWDRSDELLKPILGVMLRDILDTPKELAELIDIEEWREKAGLFKSGKHMGECAALTTFKMNLNGVIINDAYYKVPKAALFMKLQMWIAHASLRKPDIMILDPFDWDIVPEALDEVKPQKVKRSLFEF